MSPAAAPRRPGRPAQISRERIVEAAVAAGNLDTLTMRELAGRLDVSHSALYRWVRDRDELFDLVSAVIVDQVLPLDGPHGVSSDDSWRPFLAALAHAMHDRFLAVPGFATRLSRPHRHNADALGRLRGAVVGAFTAAGVPPERAEQSWYVFVTSVVGWLAAVEQPVGLGEPVPSFDVFLGVLLRGLPAGEPG